MNTTFKSGDKVVITRDGHGLLSGDVCEFFKYLNPEQVVITYGDHQYCVGLDEIKPYPINYATIEGRTYPIPDDKLSEVKKLVDPGLPRWSELPSTTLSTIEYKLKLAAEFVNEGWKPDWKDKQQLKVILAYYENDFHPDHFALTRYGVPCFKSREAALRAIELFRANGDYDELVKFYQS